MDSVRREQLRRKIGNVLSALNALREAQRSIDLVVGEQVESPSNRDPSKVRSSAAELKDLLYVRLTELMDLLTAELCISVDLPQNGTDHAIMKLVAEVLIRARPMEAEEEEGNANRRHLEKKADTENGVLRRCVSWVSERTAICGRELTAFCDVWLAISTVLLVVKLWDRYSSVDMGEMARDHYEIWLLLKDHARFTGKK